jgi:hypothetical protein
MGNTTSSSGEEPKKKSLSNIIDYVATRYILTSNFEDMRKLADMKYCNNLVILTSRIIANNLNDLEVEYLAQRIKDGVEINEMTEDNVIFLDKENLEKLDVRNQTQKRRLCIGIAKFYVKIAHVFAAITTTINPTYKYKDSTGATQEATLLNKQDIPDNAEAKIKRINICSQRLNALINDQNYDVPSSSGIKVKPKFCSLNFDPKTGKTRTLKTEPGIPELEKLYYDKYDYDNGGFTGMTKKTRTDVYEKDVEKFYRAFTGNQKIPVQGPNDPNPGKKLITSFSQIPLRDFHNSSGCKKGGPYTKEYKGSLKEKLFGDYAKHIKTMMQTANTNQDKLLEVVDDLFVFSINPKTDRKEIVVNPKLTASSLQDIVVKTRGIIVDLYLTCENDFLRGLEIFEAIVEKQIMETSQNQIEELEKTIESMSVTDDDSDPAAADVADVAAAAASADADTNVDESTEKSELPTYEAPAQNSDKPAVPANTEGDRSDAANHVAPVQNKDIKADIEGDKLAEPVGEVTGSGELGASRELDENVVPGTPQPGNVTDEGSQKVGVIGTN